MKHLKTNFLIALVLFLVISTGNVLFAQTTGKIAGKVIDAESGAPLPGANVLVEGTSMGAAASLEGDYFILNVPPGIYALRANYMGYETVKMENVKVSVNRTITIDFKLNQTVIEGKTVVVEAEKVALKKDQTSSVRNVSSEQMDVLPVESVGAVVNLQAGVVGGHFRGGRSNEVSYMVDGMSVTDSFSSGGRAVNVEADAVEEVEVIKGTFNAEYGQAMSGIVNAVTKEGGREYHGSVSGFLGNYLTPNDDIFIGLDPAEINRRQDYKAMLHGPVPLTNGKVTFFANYRYQDNKDHLNGYRLFNVTDSSYFNTDDQAQWYSERTGDSSYVPMGWGKGGSFTGKLSTRLTQNLKTSLLWVYNGWESQGYAHDRKYAPDGRTSWHNQSNMVALNLNHMLSPALFYELKISYINRETGSYIYKDPLDPGYYIHDKYAYNTGPGFYTGGQQKGHSLRNSEDLQAKFDMTWQVHKNHALKFGADIKQTTLDNQGRSILNRYRNNDALVAAYYVPEVMPDSSTSSDIYLKEPVDIAAYLQDKMEFDEMVINFGIRFDYFDPNTTYPSNRRNPVNLIEIRDPETGQLVAGTTSELVDATAKYQISPRLGLSYQLGEAALLHFSYGHFFQRPAYENFYRNNSLIINPSNFSTRQGNPELEAQKTVQYEIGLWQQLMQGMGVEVNLFYRDIYDLLSVEVVNTYNQQIYGIDTNLDYANAKGLEITYDLEYGNVFANANYTLQYTRGNASSPTTTFSRASNNQDPIPRLIPLDWDQRHTFNASVAYRTSKFNVSATGHWNSGYPYTLSALPTSALSGVNLYPNNSVRPTTYSVDLYSYYLMPLANNMKLKFELYVYNLLDRLNENGVYGRTGRAYTNIVLESEEANHRSDFNDYEDRFRNPSMYSAPRMIKFGVGLQF